MNSLEERFPAPATAKRRCLKCNKAFKSTGRENRLCDACNKSNSQNYRPARCELQGASILVPAGMQIPQPWEIFTP